MTTIMMEQPLLLITLIDTSLGGRKRPVSRANCYTSFSESRQADTHSAVIINVSAGQERQQGSKCKDQKNLDNELSPKET